MFERRAEEPVTTAVDARSRLRRLQAERLDAAEAGLGANAVYMPICTLISRPRGWPTSASR